MHALAIHPLAPSLELQQFALQPFHLFAGEHLLTGLTEDPAG